MFAKLTALEKHGNWNNGFQMELPVLLKCLVSSIGLHAFEQKPNLFRTHHGSAHFYIKLSPLKHRFLLKHFKNVIFHFEHLNTFQYTFLASCSKETGYVM